MRKKYIFLFLAIVSFITLFVSLLKTSSNDLYNQIQYSTAIREVNTLLNKKHSIFKLNHSQNNLNTIKLNTDKGLIYFQNDSILQDINNNNRTIINYKSDTNFISILKINNYNNIIDDVNFQQFNYNDKFNYYVDELNTPIYLLDYDSIDLLYCHNLKNNSSRNYFYYNNDNNDVNVLFTRANEIFFWYNNFFYYVGININLNNEEILSLIKTIIKTI